jgi:prevent-host-death family protein
MKTLPLSEVKMKLSQIVDEVSQLDEEVIITKNGRPSAVIVSPEEYESWKETNLILSDKDLMEEIQKGIHALNQNSKLYTLDELFSD